MCNRIGLVVLAAWGLSLAACAEDPPAGAVDLAGGAGADLTIEDDASSDPRCGDGIREGGEECDRGAENAPGSGCEPDCSFTCATNLKCDDLDPCNGAEVCTIDHVCKSGAPLGEGTACGVGKICKKGVCGDITCGDGIVTRPEECDDGNIADGDGCERSCRFTCLSTDPARSCAAADPCQGTSRCDDARHVCTPRTPLGDGTSCGVGRYCKAGACTQAVCGNGAAEPGETCDDGNQTAGDGCEPVTCKHSCADPAVDCKQPAPACQRWSCSAGHVCAAVADAGRDGQACGTGLVCKSGACVAVGAVCGNGAVEMGEECDFGAGNGPGTGCEASCRFSCTKSVDSCPDANPCNGAEVCTTVTVGGKTGQRCAAGTPLGDGTSCGAGTICLGGACKLSTCGDRFVDATRGEQCDPPAAGSCDAMCKKVVVAVCGNGARESGEQCDDGNKVSLDGCSATCRFEQDQRVNWFNMRFGTDTACNANALGRAVVGSLAQQQLQTALDTAVKNGSITILFTMVGLKDLSGTSEDPVSVGVLNGVALLPAGAPAYDGSSDLDWWYQADAAALDANRVPTAALAGAIAAKQLTAGPGRLTLNLTFGGGLSPFRMSGVRMAVTIGDVSTPLVAANNLPPGHLPAAHLDPTLQSFAAMGQPNLNGAGSMCANLSAASLRDVPLPPDITSICTAYTANNSMLDLLVGGCTVFFFPQIAATQPDQADPAAPVAGAGPPYRLSAGSNRVVNTCRDRNNAIVDLATCLGAAAYSSYFKFASGRVIITK